MAEVNTRPHRATMEPPVVRLAEEHERLHRLPRLPHTVCFGETRKVNWQSLISVGGAQYSVPHDADRRACLGPHRRRSADRRARRWTPGTQGGGPPPVDHTWPPGDP